MHCSYQPPVESRLTNGAEVHCEVVEVSRPSLRICRFLSRSHRLGPFNTLQPLCCDLSVSCFLLEDHLEVLCFLLSIEADSGTPTLVIVLISLDFSISKSLLSVIPRSKEPSCSTKTITTRAIDDRVPQGVALRNNLASGVVRVEGLVGILNDVRCPDRGLLERLHILTLDPVSPGEVILVSSTKGVAEDIKT